MKKSQRNLRVCPKGHEYFKSSDCPVCPVCERERIPDADFLLLIPAPARRALEAERIDSLEKLSMYSEKELLKLHGIGPGSIPRLKNALQQEGLTFKKKKNLSLCNYKFAAWHR